MKRLASVLYWAVIPAAFIGPGTITSAAKAGATYGYALLWALTFSVFACVVLQTSAARLASATGRDLGGAVAARFGGNLGRALAAGVAGAVAIGCAAYEAGNLLGASSGLATLVPADRRLLAAIVVVPAAALLWFGAPAFLARVMGACVGLMGLAFVGAALAARPDVSSMARGAVVPSLPDGSGAVALALVGTTVVPYNLFLGAGLARGRAATDVRFGTAVAVAVGGLVSAAVLVVGATTLEGFSSLPQFVASLQSRFGEGAGLLFGFGLFAAGFTSAITAPLAAGIALERTFGGGDDLLVARRARFVRLGVLLVGAAFALSDIKPVPAIIAAQALNGLILPLAAAFLLVVANDASAPAEARNSRTANLFGAIVVFVATALGASQLCAAAAATFGLQEPAPDSVAAISVVVGCAVLLLVRLGWRKAAERT